MDSKDRICGFRWIVAGLGALLMTVAMGCQTPNAVLRQQGMNALADGSIDRADNRFDLAIKHDPADWKALYYMGLVRLKENRALDAELLLERSLALRPGHDETPDILDALAESLYQQHKTPELFTMLKQAVHDYGGMRDFLRQAGYLAKTGDADGAKLAFKQAIHFAAPDDTSPFLKMADFYDSIGDDKDALYVLCEAYAVDPGSRTIGDRIRKYGVVPGPTIEIKPER